MCFVSWPFMHIREMIDVSLGLDMVYGGGVVGFRLVHVIMLLL